MNEPTPLVTINFRKLGEVQRIIDEAIAAVTNKIDVVSAGTRTLGQNSTRILFANTLAMHAVYNLTDPVLMRLLEKVLADVKSIKGDSAGFVSSSSILMLANYLAARGVKIELKTLKNAIEAGVGSIGQRDLRGITQYKSVGKILESCGRATGVKLPEGVPLAKHAEILVAISEGQGMVLIELLRQEMPSTLCDGPSEENVGAICELIREAVRFFEKHDTMLVLPSDYAAVAMQHGYEALSTNVVPAAAFAAAPAAAPAAALAAAFAAAPAAAMHAATLALVPAALSAVGTQVPTWLQMPPLGMPFLPSVNEVEELDMVLAESTRGDHSSLLSLLPNFGVDESLLQTPVQTPTSGNGGSHAGQTSGGAASGFSGSSPFDGAAGGVAGAILSLLVENNHSIQKLQDTVKLTREDGNDIKSLQLQLNSEVTSNHEAMQQGIEAVRSGQQAAMLNAIESEHFIIKHIDNVGGAVTNESNTIQAKVESAKNQVVEKVEEAHITTRSMIKRAYQGTLAVQGSGFNAVLAATQAGVETIIDVMPLEAAEAPVAAPASAAAANGEPAQTRKPRTVASILRGKRSNNGLASYYANQKKSKPTPKPLQPHNDN